VSARLDDESTALLEATRKRHLARLEGRCRKLDVLDKALILLTAAYPIKELRLAKLSNLQLEEAQARRRSSAAGTIARSTHGAAEAQRAASISGQGAPQRSGEKRSQMKPDIITFNASKALPYVDRLTTRLERRHMRAMEGVPLRCPLSIASLLVAALRCALDLAYGHLLLVAQALCPKASPTQCPAAVCTTVVPKLGVLVSHSHVSNLWNRPVTCLLKM
jgi:hypothetical protein